MNGKRYPEEFKIEAAKQVVERNHSVSSIATRLDITTHSLYAWIKKYGPDPSTNKKLSDAQIPDLSLLLPVPPETEQYCQKYWLYLYT